MIIGWLSLSQPFLLIFDNKSTKYSEFFKNDTQLSFIDKKIIIFVRTFFNI